MLIFKPVTPASPFIICGEAMIELSGVSADNAHLGVAGDVLNTGIYVARHGIPVSFLSAVGTDSMSERVVRACAAEALDTSHLIRLSDRTVGLYAIETDEKGERSFTYWRNDSAAKQMLSGADADLDTVASASLFYFSGITLAILEPSSLPRFVLMLKAIRRAGGRVAFDTNYRPRLWRDRQHALETVALIENELDMVVTTFDDDHLLFGDASPEACLHRWSELGISEVCVKHGPEGALIARGEWVRPEMFIQPIDTTGAGDSFNGGYFSARLAGATPRAAAQAGNKLAARVLGQKGAILPIE